MMNTTVKTICPYCGVGCGLSVKVRNGQMVEVKGDRDHPANYGSLCAKGATVKQIVNTSNRLAYAQIRANRSQGFEQVGFSAALARVATKFRDIIDRHGPDAVAFYVSGQLTTESQYVFNKLAKGAIGTNNIDANSRLCMASAVSAYKMALGADAPPTCYEDIELAECFFILGANMAECHPVLWQRIKRRARLKRVRTIVVDPRRTPTAEGAHLHLPIRPGTDVALLNAMIHVMIAQGWINERFIRNHTDGWETLRDCAEGWSPSHAAKICGISESDIHRAAFWFGQSAESLSFWAMGANQSTQGVAKNLGIINLHLATGKIGRPGSGPFSLTGQPNAMGGREVGYMSGLLPGHRNVSDDLHRKEIADIWGIPARRIQPKPGLDAVAMFEALEKGSVKALWVIGCNPLATMPNSTQIQRALEKAELVVVQDCYHPTETSQLAHVLLPAAMNLEMEGTMTNSERRVSLLQPCVTPPGEARPDWEIGCRVAALMGFEEQFSFSNASDIFEEHKLCCSGAALPRESNAVSSRESGALNMNGITYGRLRHHPIQWPCSERKSPGLARRYRRKIFATPNGRARFHSVEYFPPVDEITLEYPMALTTGRLAHQWHTRTKTGHVPKLNELNPEPFVAAHPEDATRLGLRDGDAVRLISRRGATRTRLKVEKTIPAGVLFMPIHWGQSAAEDGCVNNVAHGQSDPISLQPELKHMAVRLEKDGVAA
jgi:anaerobic selenocysteine-containing dehydrogenase